MEEMVWAGGGCGDMRRFAVQKRGEISAKGKRKLRKPCFPGQNWRFFNIKYR